MTRPYPDNTWLIVGLLALSAVLSASTPYVESYGIQKYQADRWVCPHCRAICDGRGGWCDQCGKHYSHTDPKPSQEDEKPAPYRDEWDDWPY